jgi:hypothetical protein
MHSELLIASVGSFAPAAAFIDFHCSRKNRGVDLAVPR